MSAFSHVRFKFWDAERYTDAQAAELRQLRALYTTHLVPVFGPALPDAFRLHTEGDDYLPAYTAASREAAPITPTPALPNASTQPFKPFADTLIATLNAYEAARLERTFGKGHPNDPTRLLGIFLKNILGQWLSNAPSNATTLRQVTALRQYIEAIATQSLFTNEGQGHDSMTVLLHNMSNPLSLLEKRLQYELRLQSAREHFAELKEGMTQALSQAADYLFHALASEDRTALPFSLVNIQSGVVNKALSTALESREGMLLKQWITAPDVVSALLPQLEIKVGDQTLPRIGFLGTQPTPLLDDKGAAQTHWLKFLSRNYTLQETLDKPLKSLTRGICPLLMDIPQDAKLEIRPDKSILADCVQLHGLMEVLAHYQRYLHQCWQLAGFGGDHCVYDQMSEAIATLLVELRVFNIALRDRLQSFQQHLDDHYKKALDQRAYKGWQANYRKAKASQERLMGILLGCDAKLMAVITHAQDTAARTERRQMATTAYEQLRDVPHFLSGVRQQLGLAPRTTYPGLEQTQNQPTAALLPPLFIAPLEQKSLSIQEIITALLPSAPLEAAILNTACRAVPTTKPWRCFHGETLRYNYLQDKQSLITIGQAVAYLAQHDQTPMTLEKRAFIESLRQQLQTEHTRITQLIDRLWWPFHIKSLHFFNTWKTTVARSLATIQLKLQEPLAILPKATSEQEICASLQIVEPQIHQDKPEPSPEKTVPLVVAERLEKKYTLPAKTIPMSITAVVEMHASETKEKQSEKPSQTFF